MKLIKSIGSQNVSIIVFATLLNFYYVIPQSYGIIVNAVILLLSIKDMKGTQNIQNTLPIRWLGFVCIYLFSLGVIYNDKLTYAIATTNVLVVIFTLSILLNSKEKITLFIKATTISGIVLGIFLIKKYAVYIGFGRFGQELPGTRIFSPITLGYIFMYISCLQIYDIFNTRNKLYKILMALAIILSLYIILLTGTRKSLMLPVLLLFVSIVIKFKDKFFKLLIISVISFATLLQSIEYIKETEIINKKHIERWEGVMSFANDNYEIDDSSLERLRLIENAKTIFYLNPLFGIGIDDTIRKIGTHPHNNYLTLLVFGGLTLMLLYYSIYIPIIRNWKTYYKLDPYLFFIVIVIIPISDLGTTSFNIFYFSTLITLLLLQRKKNTRL